MHVRTIASVGYLRKFHNATGIRHLETLLHWTLSCLLASLFWCLVLTAPPWIHANLSVRLSLVQSQLPSLCSPATNCLSWSPAPNFCSPATNCLSRAPATNCLSALQPPTLILGSSHQLSLLLSNYQLSLLSLLPPTLSLLGRVVNSHSPPRTTSEYGEISCPRILCMVSRQNRQLNRLLWQPTPIVLHWPMLIKPSFRWCRLALLFPNPPVPLAIF